MIYYFNLKETEEKDIYFVEGKHFQPFDKVNGFKDKNGNTISKEVLDKNGFFLDKNLELSYLKDNKIFQLAVNMSTKEHFYRINENTLTNAKTQEEIEKEMLTKNIATLNIENKKKDLLIENLAKQINTLNIKLQEVLTNEK